MHKAIVVIPTYNERENISRTIHALFDVFKGITTWKMEILVVDDTSPDKTYDVVKQEIKSDKRVHLLLNHTKIGLGGAYLKGMAEAFNNLGADVIFQFDGDLQHDPKIIPQMLQKLDDGYDMVLGSRYIKGGGIPQNWGLHRKFLSIVGNLTIAAVFTNFSIRDWTAGYRAIKKHVYQEIHPLLHSERFFGYTFQIGFLYNTIKRGYKVAEVAYRFVDRKSGVSKLGPEYLKNTLLFIFKVRAQEIINHRIFKFVTVGGMGALVQLSSLTVLARLLPFQLAFFCAIELAVLSNFLINNAWTFADKKIVTSALPGKFLQFNLASGGSIAIQQVVAIVGEVSFGIVPLFMLPVVRMWVSTGTIMAVVGILIGMFWNFFAYNRFVWKQASTT